MFCSSFLTPKDTSAACFPALDNTEKGEDLARDGFSKKKDQDNLS